MKNYTKDLVECLILGVILGTLVCLGIGQYQTNKITSTKFAEMNSQLRISERITDYTINGITEDVETLNKDHIKPSYEYLKSVIVYMHGKIAYYNEEEEIVEDNGYVGTGTIIKITDNYTYILTNRHMAKQQAAQVFVENIDKNDLVRAEILNNSKEVDLALVRVKGKLVGKSAIKGIDKCPQIGDKLFVVGHRMARPYVYSEGLYAGTIKWDNDKYESGHLQMPLFGGNSGSGVFNKEGKLVGLIWASSLYAVGGFIPAPDLGYIAMVQIEDINNFLQECGELE
jgi:S1-C subfamily serine protease